MKLKSLFATLFLSALVPALATAGTCEKFVGVGATLATGPASFAGEVRSNAGDLGVDVVITSAPKPTGNGALNATTSHTFVIGTAVITTRDRVRLVPVNDTGLYRLDTQASIVEGGWGHLKIDGLVNLWTGWAQWLVEGEVCTD